MNCPRCNDVELLEKDRDGITVDGCPRCRGIWLDRGELERLLDSMARHHDEEDRRERDGRGRDPRHHDRDGDHGRDPYRHGEPDRYGGRGRDSDYLRHPDGRRRKPRTWLEGLKDMFD